MSKGRDKTEVDVKGTPQVEEMPVGICPACECEFVDVFQIERHHWNQSSHDICRALISIALTRMGYEVDDDFAVKGCDLPFRIQMEPFGFQVYYADKDTECNTIPHNGNGISLGALIINALMVFFAARYNIKPLKHLHDEKCTIPFMLCK